MLGVEPIGEVRSLDKGRREVTNRPGLAEVMDRHDARMVEPGDGLGLAEGPISR